MKRIAHSVFTMYLSVWIFRWKFQFFCTHSLEFHSLRTSLLGLLNKSVGSEFVQESSLHQWFTTFNVRHSETGKPRFIETPFLFALDSLMLSRSLKRLSLNLKNNLATVSNVTKPPKIKKRIKIALVPVIPGVTLAGYYYAVLNSKEKRKVRVNFESFFRLVS